MADPKEPVILGEWNPNCHNPAHYSFRNYPRSPAFEVPAHALRPDCPLHVFFG